VSIQEAAVQRLQKLLEPLSGEAHERGRVVVFSSAKPGSGASTLALQTAYALRRAAGRRVLLMDFDLQGSSLDFFLGLNHDRSIVDLLQSPGRIESELWSQVLVDANGVDVLPGPALPYTEALPSPKLQEIFERARNGYEWTVVDLPSIFHRLSLECVAACDRAFLVSTSELASLHLTRRAVKLLAQLAFDSSKYQVLVNRMEGRTELNSSDLSKLFECHVDKGLPNERLQLERVLTLGQPLDSGSELGRAVEGLASKLLGALPEKKRIGPMLSPRPAFSQT
jgi:pilus assembly protein CpaE